MKRDDPEQLLAQDPNAPVVNATINVNAITKRKRKSKSMWSRSQCHAGIPLLCEWLSDEARRRGHSAEECSAVLGVTKGYLHQLRSGIRCAGKISSDFARRCARYLGVPTILVLIAGGRLSPSDLALPDEADEVGLGRAVSRMMTHRMRPLFSSDDIAKTPQAVQRWVLERFGESVGEDMFYRPNLPAALDALRVPALRLGLAAAGTGHEADAALASEAQRLGRTVTA